MNPYDRMVAQMMFVPGLLGDLAIEWDEATTPKARAWLEAPETRGQIGVMLAALSAGDLTDLPDEAINALWTLEQALAEKRKQRGPVRFSARDRNVIVTEVIRRAILWKMGTE